MIEKLYVGGIDKSVEFYKKDALTSGEVVERIDVPIKFVKFYIVKFQFYGYISVS